MYELKKIPEDFVVEEIPDRELGKKGNFAVFELKKKDYTTEEAVRIVAHKLKIDRKRIKYAGTKDRHAITTQRISVYKVREQNLESDNITLKFLGYSKEPVSLGSLKGNKFTIVVRNLEKNAKIKKLNKIPNLFDQQRFSNNNVGIGRAILKRDFEKTVKLIDEKKLNDFLKKYPHNYVGALRLIPLKILTLYVHAYQSFIWNKSAEEYLKINGKEKVIPIIGFSTELKGDLKKIIEKIMKEEKITQRDFIIREMPELTSEGTERILFADVKNLEIGKLEEDELNKEKYKVKVKFELQKGSYATNVVKFLMP
jgi:tRNA pseudouridine13 synthase